MSRRHSTLLPKDERWERQNNRCSRSIAEYLEKFTFLSVKVNKTDRNDARGIADAMRCELYKEVKPKKKDEIALTTLLNGRKQLVDQRVELFNCIRGLFKPFGIRKRHFQAFFFAINVGAKLL